MESPVCKRLASSHAGGDGHALRDFCASVIAVMCFRLPSFTHKLLVALQTPEVTETTTACLPPRLRQTAPPRCPRLAPAWPAMSYTGRLRSTHAPRHGQVLAHEVPEFRATVTAVHLDCSDELRVFEQDGFSEYANHIFPLYSPHGVVM